MRYTDWTSGEPVEKEWPEGGPQRGDPMASVVIRKAWFSRATTNTMKVPASGVGPPQVSEAEFLTNLAGLGLKPGTRTTQAAGAVTVGNVVSSTPAAGASAAQGSTVAYLVSI